MRARYPKLVATAAATLTLFAAACTTNKPSAAPTSTPDPVATAGSATFPVTITASNGPVAIKAKPARIVSMSPSMTEDLFAEGAGPQVVAVDKDSDYPASAPHTALDGFTPNLEAIAGYHPDLVIITDDVKNQLVSGLNGLGIPVLLEPAAATLADAYQEMTQIGQATGHVAEATSLVQATRQKIQDLVASMPTPATALTYFYEVDNTLYTATSKTFIGSLFSLIGMKNIADPHDDGSGYPQLNTEELIAANPDYVFLADTKCCAQTATTVGARPGYSTLTAVKDHHIVALDDDIASRWGPRVVDLLQAIVDGVEGATPAAGRPAAPVKGVTASATPS